VLGSLFISYVNKVTFIVYEISIIECGSEIRFVTAVKDNVS